MFRPPFGAVKMVETEDGVVQIGTWRRRALEVLDSWCVQCCLRSSTKKKEWVKKKKKKKKKRRKKKGWKSGSLLTAKL